MIGATLALEHYDQGFMRGAAERNGVAGTIPQPGELESIAEQALAGAVRCALDAAGYVSLRNLAVENQGGSIKLDGQVSSYHLKQLAQTIVKRVPGVVLVVNAVEVVNGR